MKPYPYYLTLFILSATQTALAGTGQFFNVTASGGAPSLLEFTLCLNARGPLTCQNDTANNLNLSITTTPNHTYSSAGIKMLTPGYQLSGCTMIPNGYCIFTVSNTTTANIQRPTKESLRKYVRTT